MHFTTRRFWGYYKALPETIQEIADQSYELLKTNPSHPSLRLKREVFGELRFAAIIARCLQV
jgi:hypothetical protein